MPYKIRKSFSSITHLTLFLSFLKMPKPLASPVLDFPEPIVILPNLEVAFCSDKRAEQFISFNNDNNNNNFESVLFSKAYPSSEDTNFSKVVANFTGYSPPPLPVNDRWSEEYPIYEEKHFMQQMGSEEADCLSLDVTMGGSYQGQEQGFFSSNNLELLGDTKSKQQQQYGLIVTRCNNAAVASNISTSEELPFKVGRISAEERKEKIRRYIKKRNERNFTKKIMYACRKTLADNRPRVRGRFAKNEFGNVPRSSIDNNDDEVVLKDEESYVSSKILLHIIEMNSFKYNCTLHSWI